MHLNEGFVAILEVAHDSGSVVEVFFFLNDGVYLRQFSVYGDDELRIFLDSGGLVGCALAEGAVAISKVSIGLGLSSLGAPLYLLVGKVQ